MSKRAPILDEIVKLAKMYTALKQPLKAIFDLDSTLFDVSPRIARILQDFAAEPEILVNYPNEARVLALVEPDVRDYGVRRTLERYQFDHPNPEFAKNLIEYWKRRFFGNDYLKYDKPYPGAVQFVNELVNAGADIYYLTGRDIPRMLPGSIASLRQHGFPLDPSHTNLILKKETGADDALFKKEFFEKLDHSGSQVWFFENEPANIHLVVEHCPHIKVLFVETVHSESAPLPGDEVPKILGFV